MELKRKDKVLVLLDQVLSTVEKDTSSAVSWKWVFLKVVELKTKKALRMCN